MNVLEIVLEYLIDNNLDGLQNHKLNCGCHESRTGISPEECLNEDCVPVEFPLKENDGE